MKIAIVSNSPTRGTGFGQQTKLLAQGFTDRGHSVTVICEPHLTKNEFPWDEIKTEAYDSAGIDRVLADLQPNVAIFFDSAQRIHEWMNIKVAAANIPLYYWYPYEGSSVPDDYLDMFYGIRPGAVIHLSYFSRNLWERAESDRVIYHAVNPAFRPLDTPKRTLRKKWSRLFRAPIFPDAPLVINLNRNFWHKGWDLCFDYIRQMKEIEPDIQFLAHTVSKVDEARGGFDLPKIARIFGIEENIIFSGFDWKRPLAVEELNEIINMADWRIDGSHGEGFGLCLHPDSAVYTKRGAIPISQVVPGDETLTHEGIYRKVLATISRPEPNLVDVRLGYRPTIRVTKEHPFLIKSVTGEVGWKSVCNLLPNDLVAAPKPVGDKPLPEFIDLADYCKDCEFDTNEIWHRMGFSGKDSVWSYSSICKKYSTSKKIAENARRMLRDANIHGTSEGAALAVKLSNDGFEAPIPVKIKRLIPVDSELLAFIGWYLAEGSGDGSRCEFSLGRDERHIAEWLNNYAERSFGISADIRECQDKSAIRVIFKGKALVGFLTSFCGKGAANKSLHESFLGCEKSLLPLVSGFIKGDGHIHGERNTLSFTTISPSLAYQVTNILASNGILASLKWHQDRAIFEGSVVRHHLKRAARLLGIDILFRRDSEESRKHKPAYEETDSYFFLPIRRIQETKNEAGSVCDLSVDGSRSFVANGIVVHNTVAECVEAGLPQIVTDHTTMREIVGKDYLGLIPPATTRFSVGTSWKVPNIPAYVEVSRRIMESPEKFSYDQADFFSVDSMITAWEEVFEQDLPINLWDERRYGYRRQHLLRGSKQSVARIAQVLKASIFEIGPYDGELIDWATQFGVTITAISDQLTGDSKKDKFIRVNGIGETWTPADMLVFTDEQDSFADQARHVFERFGSYQWLVVRLQDRFIWGSERFSADQMRKIFESTGHHRREDMELIVKKKLPFFDYEIWGLSEEMPEALLSF